MKIIIGAVGKMKKKSPEEALINEYVSKTRWPVEIKEVEEKRTLPVDELKSAESELLLKALPNDAKIVVLDERGETLSSRELAGRLRIWQDSGVGTVAFLIGGANGHSETLRQRADLKLSFGRMTLPHMLMRVVLAEQIYRAKTILDGHPYHKD
ncbi:MAG: 23S rRNA (pseudouridine(1915)-N(3))-methyltransferase RlmH [Alphaproteobacteria bacterium]|nr:23S rRNA (pseudouridine(1915)-N(3))-methyltransferase RlmH [Alphaproteobacteria bacterium]